MSRFLRHLNDEQRAAIEEEGNVLLLACPGSGKTRTLIHKIATELSKINSHREYVVALTYTHVAAEEIRDRIDALGVDTDQLWVGTIHSFCLQWILRPYAIYHESLQAGFGIIDTLEREEMLDEIAKRNGIPGGHHDCKYYATEGGYHLDRHTPQELREPIIRTVKEYHSKLLDRHQIDFEMMLRFSHDLIVRHAPIAKRLGQLFRIVAIDEYQDTRDIQYRIVAQIVRKSGGKTRLFAVGDPNQAIFSSLGGVAKSSQEIEELTGSSVAEKFLYKNYRSSQQIIDYFSLFAVRPMEIESAGELREWQGHLVHDISLHKAELVQEIANLVRHNIESLGVRADQICIIAPWWIHLASMTRALVHELPDYEFNGPGLSPFGQNLDNFWYKVARIALTESAPDMYRKRIRWGREVVDQLVLYGHLDESWTVRDFLRVTNGISIVAKKGSAFLEDFFEDMLEMLGIHLRTESELASQLASFLERMATRLSEILKRELVDVDDLEAFKRVFRPRTGIVISTIHGVKGTEFDSVIAFGLLEGLVPHYNEPQQEKDPVAKRLLFVIGSRARKHLYLISEKGRGNDRYPKYQSNVLRNMNYQYTSGFVARIEGG